MAGVAGMSFMVRRGRSWWWAAKAFLVATSLGLAVLPASDAGAQPGKAPPAKGPPPKAPPKAPGKGGKAPPEEPNTGVKKLAQDAYKEGKKKFDAGDYAGALEHFKKADELYPGAAPKFYVAATYDKLGKVEEAIAAYKAFVESNPGEKYADRVIESGKRITELQSQLDAVATLSINPPVAGATVTVDGAPVTGTELKLKAGRHTVVVTAPGYDPATLTVDVNAGQKLDIPVTLVATVAAEGEGEGESSGGMATGLQIGGFVCLGLAVAAGVVTTVFGVQALGAKSDFDELPNTDSADKAESNAVLSDVFLGVTLGTAIAGVVLLAFGFTMEGSTEEEAGQVRILPLAGPQGGGAQLRVGF
jgi:PEGA domain-containing protein